MGAQGLNAKVPRLCKRPRQSHTQRRLHLHLRKRSGIAKTEQLVDGLDLELWCQGGRYVARIAAPGQSDKEPSQVVQADPAALLTQRKHLQIERDYIGCTTLVVTRQSDNSQDCHSNHAGDRTPEL